MGASRYPDIEAFATQVTGSHHIFDSAQFFVGQQLVVIFSHIGVFLRS
jgi:hypothetical protein